MAAPMRNANRVEKGKSDNSPGEIEIPYVIRGIVRYKEVFSAHESLFLFSNLIFQCFLSSYFKFVTWAYGNFSAT